MLELDDVHTYYGDSYILQGVSLQLQAGQVVSLLGRNGAGKTTTINSIIGLVRPDRGRIAYKGTELTALPSHRIARLGIALVPQGRRLFPNLSVRENITLAARGQTVASGWTFDRVCELFPVIKERAQNSAEQLSGGEQQMVALARALMTNPDLILLDEPSEGLAPRLVREVKQILLRLKASDLSILLVEQNMPLATEVADQVYIMNKGRIVYEGDPDGLREAEGVKRRYLGV